VGEKTMEKTKIRWKYGIIIVFLLVCGWIIQSAYFTNLKINISSDSETYNITKIVMDGMIKVSEKQDLTYKELVLCQTELEIYKKEILK